MERFAPVNGVCFLRDLSRGSRFNLNKLKTEKAKNSGSDQRA